jgi:hypothetical protein
VKRGGANGAGRAAHRVAGAAADGVVARHDQEVDLGRKEPQCTPPLWDVHWPGSGLRWACLQREVRQARGAGGAVGAWQVVEREQLCMLRATAACAVHARAPLPLP